MSCAVYALLEIHYPLLWFTPPAKYIYIDGTEISQSFQRNARLSPCKCEIESNVTVFNLQHALCCFNCLSLKTAAAVIDTFVKM
jgi:hypothetical protein